MNFSKLEIDGSWIFEAHKFEDNRGHFFESFKLDFCEQKLNRKFQVKQANTSLSKKGSVRGIHYALIPPSQAKFIQCQRGSILDYIIDIRIDSPTFMTYQAIELNSEKPQAIFIEEGLAHAFVALENETLVTYLVNQNYNPEKEKGINPFDKDLNIAWPKLDLLLSDKDKNEISLETAHQKNLLPNYAECKKYINSLI